jgi:hypothetical protein
MSHPPDPASWRDAKRRRQSSLLAYLVVAMLAVGGVGLGVWLNGLRGGPAVDAASLPLCPGGKPLAAKSVRVNVYNATPRLGLADRAATALGARGFAVQVVANDPARAKVANSAVVRHGPKGKPAAAMVAAQVAGARLQADRRTSGTVDLVLGAKYAGLARVPSTPTCRTAIG